MEQTRLTDADSRFSFPTQAKANQITRLVSGTFQSKAARVFCKSKYGTSTTNWNQLNKRLKRNLAGRTPMLFLGISPEIIT